MLAVLDAHKATLAAPTASSQLPQHVRSQFVDEAELLCVPTGAGARGLRAIEEFVRTAGKQAHIIERDELVSRIRSERSVVEESVLTLTHSEAIDWLLPGVRPTKKRIVVALVSIVTFGEDGRIVSKRIYWDQASVLRQAGVLPRSLYCKANASEVQLPILGAEAAEALLAHPIAAEIGTSHPAPSLVRAHLKMHLSHSHLPNARSSAPFNPKEPEQKPVQAAATPARRRESAAGIIPQGDEQPVKSTPARPPSDIFGLAAPADAPPTPSAAKTKRTSSSLSYILGGSGDDAATAGFGNNTIDASASLQPLNAGHHQNRPSSRITQPAGGRSSNIFSSDPEPVRSSVPIDPKRYVTHVSLAANEAVGADERLTTTGRRVFADRTNKSQFSLGGSEDVEQQAPAVSARPINGNNLIVDGAGTLPGEQHLGTGRRTFPGRGTESHFTLKNEAGADQEAPAAIHTGKKTIANSNASHFTIGLEEQELAEAVKVVPVAATADVPAAPSSEPSRPSGRRNPNAESIEPAMRPSSRVLRAPGGGSSITFA